MNAIQTSRKRGRPRADPETHQPAARGQILDALIQLLDAQPLVRPSLRTVAQTAGVTPALLHYHFGDQQGLMTSLVKERAQPQIQPLSEELQLREGSAAAALARFLSKWTALTMRRRWLMACLLQTPTTTLDSLGSIGSVLCKVVTDAQRQGSVRQGLPADYIALLLLTLGAMPHLAQTAIGVGLAASDTDPESASRLTMQHLSLMQTGVARH